MSRETISGPASSFHKWFEVGALPREIQKIVAFYVAINLLFGFGDHITPSQKLSP